MWNFEKYAENTAVIDDRGNRICYADLQRAGEELCAAVGDRCLVFSICNNEIGSIVGYTGFLNGRIVPAMLSAGLDEEMLGRLLQDYRPAFVWAPKHMMGQGALAQYPAVYSRWEYVLLKTPYGMETKVYEELALLLTTSGSTGSPKFVRQSYANIRANTDSIVEYLHLDASERPITTLPMNYTYGISIINSHLDVGATILLTDKTLMQREFWDFFKQEGATSFGGVPYTYEMLKRLRFFRMDLPTLRTMTQAGGKLLPELHQEFAEYAQKTGKEFVVMYGQCEATARMGYLPPQMALAKCGSMGIAIPGGTFCLIDVNGQPISEPMVTGELVYKGANVTLGYDEKGEDLIKGDERGGVLQTGDMAQVDKDGYYYIVGRKKRFLKVYGNRVNLDEIERMIKNQFDDIDCASAGVDDHMYLFVTDPAIADSVKKYVATKTKLNPTAFRVLTIEEIPKNDAGKTLYKELAKYYS